MKKGSIGVGTLWMMMVFVILCMTVFATLAVLGANRDKRFTEHTVESVKHYYLADARAEERLARIDEMLYKSHGLTLEDVATNLWAYGHVTPLTDTTLELSFQIACGTFQELVVVLQIEATEQDGENVFNYTKKAWYIKNIESLDYEDEGSAFDELIIGG